MRMVMFLAGDVFHRPITGHGHVPRTYERIPASPWGNELVEKLVEAAIDGEKLGQRGATDLLAISFSSNDYVGHQTGPDAPEVRDMCIRTDRLLARLFEVVGEKVGLGNALFVLTADHGVSPAPEVQAERKMPGGYIYVDIEDIVRSALFKKFGADDLVLGSVDNAVYLDYKALGARKIDLAAACQAAAEALMAVPQAHVARVFTSDRLRQGIAGDRIASAVMNGYYPERSGDIIATARTGEVDLDTDAPELELVMLDGLRTQARRVKVDP